MNPSPKLPPSLLLGIGIGLAMTGIFSAVQYISDQQHYHEGVQAYRNADCATAIKQFDRVIHSTRLLSIDNFVPRAQQKQTECEYFQRGVDQQQAGKFEAALSNYAVLARVYADSPLIKPAREQVRDLLQLAKIDTLATSRICTQLDSLANQNLISKTDALPQFYLACGKSYEANRNYKQAIALYQKFLNQNPSTQTQAMQRALARATVADIRSQGAAVQLGSFHADW